MCVRSRATPQMQRWSTRCPGQKDTSKAAKGATKKAADVKEEISEEKAVKESQPGTGAKESPKSARSAVVLTLEECL